jgi:hypothetical protein
MVVPGGTLTSVPSIVRETKSSADVDNMRATIGGNNNNQYSIK